MRKRNRLTNLDDNAVAQVFTIDLANCRRAEAQSPAAWTWQENAYFAAVGAALAATLLAGSAGKERGP